MQQKQAMRSLSVYKAVLNERGDPTARVSVNDVGNYTLAEQFARFLEKNVNQILETKNSSKHIILKSCEKLDDSLLVKLVSGASGEHVDVVDVGLLRLTTRMMAIRLRWLERVCSCLAHTGICIC